MKCTSGFVELQQQGAYTQWEQALETIALVLGRSSGSSCFHEEEGQVRRAGRCNLIKVGYKGIAGQSYISRMAFRLIEMEGLHSRRAIKQVNYAVEEES